MTEESYVLNLDDVKQSLLEMPDEIVRDCFADALRAGAEVVESELRARTPLGADDKEQEHLRGAIETKVLVDTLDGSAETGFGDLGYRAVFVEYGHRIVTHDGKDVGFGPAHPFIRPAAESATEGAVEAFEESIQNSLA
jgi:HK97 gp10 family phage protein